MLAELSAAEDLERFLGDPFDGQTTFGFSGVVADDEAEAFPERAERELRRWGHARHLVPIECGGALGSFVAALHVGRAIARRDLTVAIATGQTLLGALPVWLDGTDAQKSDVARWILGGDAGCLALTEEEHGGDLLACEVGATPTPRGWRLGGTKWCINNGTRGRFATVLARTGGAAELRAHTILLVDKSSLEPGCVEHLPKRKTHGIRGADISGMRFRGAELGAAATVGRSGHGIELVSRLMQVSRTMCASFSLGAGDTAIRLALRFAMSRVLYSRPAYDIPAVRRALTDAYVDLLVVEALSLVAARTLSIRPAEMGLVSSIVKYLVPTTTDALIARAAVVLGARHYLREGEYAVFQKLMRDHAVVALFDGSTAVNLYLVSGQLPRLAQLRREADASAEAVADVFRMAPPAPVVSFRELRPTNRGLSTLMTSVRALVEWSRRDAKTAPFGAEIAERAAELLMAIADIERRAEAQATKPQTDPETFRTASKYCHAYAGVAALGYWLHNRDALGASSQDGAWLAIGLARLLAAASGRDVVASETAYERVASLLARPETSEHALSTLPLPITPS